MTTCTGRGDNGDHCCWIGGKVCHYLDTTSGTPRCGLLVELGTWDAVHQDRRYRRSKVGRWFKDNHPGYGCGDWPQNIPPEQTAGAGLCCWNPPVEVTIS